ncbi:MAG: SpoIID/LytB domain-containing protein, partial [Acidimicrobiia bacterium]
MGELWVRRFGSVAAFTLLLAAAIPPAQAVVPAVVLEGSGWGHGVGMAQDGAYWMGRAGIDTAGILGQFYPGTRTARAGGPVRVAVAATRPGDALLAFPGGGEIRDARTGPLAAGFPLRIPPGGQVLVRYDGGRYSAQPLAGAGSPGPPSEPGTAPSTPRTLWAIPRPGTTVALPATGHRYRGMIEAVGLPGGPGLRLLNEVDVEAYLRGMGEVRDPSWPPASLRAQAIAARTYALRAMATSGEICADERCQVYLGQQAEYPAMDEAVVRTSGLVLTFAGQLASTVYSANGGGESASREEGFGPAAAGPPADYPYLRAAPYPTRDPDPWSVVVALERVAARLGYPGELSSVSVVEAGPSGRALRVALDGSAGTRTVTGIEVARALGLRSTRFRAHGTVGAGAPA